MHPAYAAGVAQVVGSMGNFFSRYKLKVETRSAPGYSVLLLMDSQTGASTDPVG
jgi:hypothetical protein